MEFDGVDLSQKSVLIVGAVCLAYVLIVRAFGSYFARFNNNINDFFFSGQRFSWWLPAASMVATGIGSYSFLKYSQQGYNTGMSSTITYMNDWFAIPFFVFGWLPIIYFARIKSVPEYFERRFNSLARYISLVIILGYMFFYIGYNLYTIGIAMQGLFGIPQLYSVPVLGVFIGVYVTFGGQTAVIFTDLFQGVMLYLAGFLAIFAGIYALGGFSEWWAWLPETHRLPFTHLTENPKFNTAGLFWGEALAGSIAFGFMNQGFLMRYLTIKSVDEGRKAAFFNVLVTLPVSAIIVGAIGWIAKALMTKQAALGGALPGYDLIEINNTFHTFLVVCWATVKQNAWVFGFIISALMAALMSTIDTLINACAAVGIYDLYKPLVKKNASDEHYLKAARWASVVTTITGILLVIWFNTQKGSLMSIHYKGIMIIIPSVVTTIFLGAFWRSFTSLAACISMLVGSAITILTVWFPEMIDGVAWYVSGPQNDQYIYMRALYGMLITGGVGVLVTFLQKWFSPQAFLANREKVKGLTIDTLDLAMANYKGGTPNHVVGKNVHKLNVKIDSRMSTGVVGLSKNNMEQLKVNDKDMVYITDSRWHLGGLRSDHVKVVKKDDINDTQIKMAEETFKSAYFLKDKQVNVEKIF